MDIDRAIKLCRATRKDLRKLQAALKRKDFYDVGHDIGKSSMAGLAYKDVDKELLWLEQLVTVENYPVICKETWTIFDLVNFYDRLIDQIKLRDLSPERTPAIVNSLYKWRDCAGKLAQVVCQIQDAESL